MLKILHKFLDQQFIFTLQSCISSQQIKIINEFYLPNNKIIIQSQQIFHFITQPMIIPQHNNLQIPTLNPNPHQPLISRQIQYRYLKSKHEQNKYQFPRKKQSGQSSSSNKSLPFDGFYNLYWQNRFNRRKEDELVNRKVKVENKGKDKEYRSKGKVEIVDVKDQKKDIIKQRDNIENVEHRQTKILSLKEIKKYNERHPLPKRQKIKVISKQNSPVKQSNVQKRQIQLYNSVNKGQLDFPTIQTPKKKEANTEHKTKQKSKRKIEVMSSKKLRRIQNLLYFSTPTTPKKGMRVFSHSKSNQKNQRRTSAQGRTSLRVPTKTYNI